MVAAPQAQRLTIVVMPIAVLPSRVGEHFGPRNRIENDF